MKNATLLAAVLALGCCGAATAQYRPTIAGNGDIRNFDNDGDGRREPTYVRGYSRRDGTYVRDHYRARARRGLSPMSAGYYPTPPGGTWGGYWGVPSGARGVWLGRGR